MTQAKTRMGLWLGGLSQTVLSYAPLGQNVVGLLFANCGLIGHTTGSSDKHFALVAGR